MDDEHLSLSRRSFLASGLGLIVLCTLGCGEAETPQHRHECVRRVHEQLTDEECQAFVESMTQAAKAGDLDTLSWMIDYHGIIDRATTPTQGSEEFNDLFRLATFRDLAGDTGLPMSIVKLMKEGGEFRCLRIYTAEGTKRAVFRLLVEDRPSLDYYEFVLSPHANGKSLIADYYFFRSGEMVSEGVRRRYRLKAAVGSKALAREEPTDADLELMHAIGQIAQMGACLMADDAQRALEIYADLPASFQNDKFVLLNRLDAANRLGGTEYIEAMEAIESALVDDPCLDFLLIDYYAHCQQFDKMRMAIDRVDQRVGGDAYQDARRALSYFLEKKYKLAREYAQKAIDAEDTLHLPHRVVMLVALEEREFDEVCRLLPMMLEKGIIQASAVEIGPAYAEFRQSAQYQQWLKQADTESPHPND